MKKPVIDRNRPLGLYLHIPFCKAKCAYCDFYSLPRSEGKAKRVQDNRNK